LTDGAWPASIDPELASRIVDVIVKEGVLDRTALRPSITLEELKFDSLEAIMIINGIEDAFDIRIGSDLRLGDAQDLGDLVALLADAVTRAAPTRQS
jgi:acyl carrier protein